MTSLRKSRPALRSRTSRRRLPTVQPLEARNLLSAISVVDNGTLTIEADDRPNLISVWNNAETGVLVVQVDDTKLRFRSAAVSHIQISGNGGDDRIGVRDSVTQTTRIEGGNGSDLVFAGQGDDDIQGGRGVDYLIGGSDNDEIIIP